MRFVHLHVHSHYSLLDGLGQIPQLVARAKELGMDALAITDHGVMYGVIEFYEECQKQGIKPIIGMEAYVSPHGMLDKAARVDDRAYHLTLLAENLAGYRNLIKITTAAHLEGFYYKPRVDLEFLRSHAEGVIALSGCLNGQIPRALEMKDEAKAEDLLRIYQDIFGRDNFFLEVQDHEEIPEQVEQNAQLLALADRLNVPLVATKDCHYIHAEDREAQDVLLAIGTGKTLEDPTRFSMRDADYSLTSPEDMARAFAHRPDAIENTAKIADRCAVTIKLGTWVFPEFPIPDGLTADAFLRKEVEEGLRAKGQLTPEYQKRLDYELDIITTKGYATYFLVVADYTKWARSQGIISTTRGSAAGSLACYGIGITTVDPLAYKLPFERFLNPSRPSPPDIDMDFADTKRDLVLDYVKKKYGADRVAQICTFGTMAARGSVRDVSRALGYPYGLGDRIAKMIPMGSQGFHMTIARALKETPELQQVYDTEPDVRRVIDLAQKIEGCARHTSVHAAGVVIAPGPLTDWIPLQREAGGDHVITQYDMHASEQSGILKMDFLGIRNLSILATAVEVVEKTKGVKVDLLHLPLDDKRTYDLLARGQTTGLFQLGGEGMTKYIIELQPATIFDLMAMVALYRPGPIESIPEYIRRKRNPRLVRVLDPRMKEILSMSYGIITYQDDVLLIAIHLAGYDWAEADKLRKAMGKKIPKEMAAQKEKFLTGCVKGGMTEDKAVDLWKLIEPFAAYGFNKAHAASYAIVAYQTAYMKANYPAEYMAAVMTNESGDMPTVAAAINECTKMGIKVLPPDVNSSLATFTYIDGTQIRFGLNAIKNLGGDTVAALINERKTSGPFMDLTDLARRLPAKVMNRKAVEALAKSGALDALGERNAILGNVEELLRFNKDAAALAVSNQASLFSAGGSFGTETVRLKAVDPATKRDILSWEKELLGMYVSEHPFREVAAAAAGELAPIATLTEMKKGSFAVIGGMLQAPKRITTKKGEAMLFVRIEDETSGVEIVVFPRVYAAQPELWMEDAAVVVSGKISDKDDELRFLANQAVVVNSETVRQAVRALQNGAVIAAHAKESAAVAPPVSDADTAPRTLPSMPSVTITLPDAPTPELAQELKTVFEQSPGNLVVFLEIGKGERPKRIETQFRIGWSPQVAGRICALPGIGGARVVGA
ncbi:MAG: DNA polymerase III subunit alpha [Patescibacteria group bacterium]